MTNKVVSSSFVIATNGFADGPAQALRDYLNKNKAAFLTEVNHPLVEENKNEHIVTMYKNGQQVRSKVYKLPNRPPYTFMFDPFVPLKLPECDVWFGFNNLACLRGLLRKKVKPATNVYYWAVDFVPGRFGKGLLTKTYNNLDRYVCNSVDARIELSQAALDGRSKYLGLTKVKSSPAIVVPMGAWLNRTPKATSRNWESKTVIYLGHLVERQGVDRLVKAVAILVKQGLDIKLGVIGSGPLAQELRQLTKELGIDGRVKFHGFVKDHKVVEKIISAATIAAAPYVQDRTSFTQYADPGKLKAYLGCGLPIIMTDVPPNAKEIQKAGAAIIVSDNPISIAEGIEAYFSNEAKWRAAHQASLTYAREYDWNLILGGGLRKIGFET